MLPVGGAQGGGERRGGHIVLVAPGRLTEEDHGLTPHMLEAAREGLRRLGRESASPKELAKAAKQAALAFDEGDEAVPGWVQQELLPRFARALRRAGAAGLTFIDEEDD